MKTGFKGPLKPEKTQKKEAPWDFHQPQRDDSTSCYVNAGSHYGTGMAQPVGHKGEPKMFVEALPYGRVETMVTHYNLSDNLPIEVQE